MELMRTFIVNGWELKVVFDEPERGDRPSKTDDTPAAPGAGKYTLNTFQLESEKLAAGEPLNLKLQLSGENIAFLYTEIYFKDSEFNYYYGPLTQEFVRSESEKENHGAIHPVWDSEINLSLAITPLTRVLTDGQNAAFAFMHPLAYGEVNYLMEGFYIKNGSIEPDRARLKFDDSGELTDKRIILEKHGRLATHELSFKPGDQFIPAVHVLTELNLTNPKMKTLHGVTGALVKQEEPFHWVDEAALAGDYLLGLVIEDFNGDKTHHYLPFSIEGNQE